MELKVGQNLFEAIKDLTGFKALESDMQAILWAVEEDNNLKDIDDDINECELLLYTKPSLTCKCGKKHIA